MDHYLISEVLTTTDLVKYVDSRVSCECICGLILEVPSEQIAFYTMVLKLHNVPNSRVELYI